MACRLARPTTTMCRAARTRSATPVPTGPAAPGERGSGRAGGRGPGHRDARPCPPGPEIRHLGEAEDADVAPASGCGADIPRGPVIRAARSRGPRRGGLDGGPHGPVPWCAVPPRGEPRSALPGRHDRGREGGGGPCRRAEPNRGGGGGPYPDRAGGGGSAPAKEPVCLVAGAAIHSAGGVPGRAVGCLAISRVTAAGGGRT